MTPENVSSCVTQVRAFLGQQKEGWANTSETHFSTIIHNLDQIRNFATETQAGYTAQLEQKLKAVVATPIGDVAVSRVADLLATKVGSAILHETKVGGGTPAKLAQTLDVNQMVDHMLVLFEPKSFGILEKNVTAVWGLAGAKATAANQNVFLEQMKDVQMQLKLLKFDDATVAELMGKFHVRFKSEAEGAAEGALGPAMHVIFGPDGKMSLAAVEQAKNSPNFKPAMEEVLGANGKMADAAKHAAEGANFDTAEQDLEKKVEKTLTDGFEAGGTKGAQEAGKKLHEKISGGASELGNILTSIPNLVNNVKSLGDAWDKPNKGLGEYMAIMSGLGGVVSSAGGVIQAFAGAQQLATAAQAAFNFVANMNPFVLITIAVIALIAVVVALVVYWDEIKAAIRDNPWIAVIAVLFGVIGVIVLVIAYWDEIKLAVLQAANFVSIQIQRIGGYFIGLRNLAGMVWDWIVARLENVGISIMNVFITIGADIQNFLIGIVNFILAQYNALATSVVGETLGLKTAALIPEVNVQAKLIPPKDVPQIDVEAAFKPMTEAKTGGLEGQIVKQQAVVEQAKLEDEERRAKAAKEKAEKDAAAPGAAPGPLAAPPIAGLPAAVPGAPPVADAFTASGAASSGGVTVQGGITVTINADRLEANASQMLSDEIVRGLSERLCALQGDASRRMGVAAA